VLQQFLLIMTVKLLFWTHGVRLRRKMFTRVEKLSHSLLITCPITCDRLYVHLLMLLKSLARFETIRFDRSPLRTNHSSNRRPCDSYRTRRYIDYTCCCFILRRERHCSKLVRDMNKKKKKNLHRIYAYAHQISQDYENAVLRKPFSAIERTRSTLTVTAHDLISVNVRVCVQWRN
jgi:hypothetical protein